MLDFSQSLDLPLIWAGIIGTAVFVYVFLDGFDLGCGILFPLAPTDNCRSRIMNSIAPFWDGNETWLVMGGGGLFAAFPVAYGIIMSGIYIPVTLILFGLILRGVAFEFRFKASGKSRKLWDWVFTIGSTIATFFQGVVLGTLLGGLTVENRTFAGGSFDWLGIFPLFCGFALIVGYSLLGTTWLIMKTDGETQAWARNNVEKLIIALVACLAIVSLWMPVMNERIRDVWFGWPSTLFLLPLPLLTAGAIYLLWRDRNSTLEYRPFFLTMLLFLFSFVGFCISMYPWVVPYEMTIYEAAAAPTSQSIMLIGAGIMIPIIGIYTAYSYYVFRGKSGHEAMY